MTSVNNIESGKTAWRSPSNIALVKYWGKKPVQIPANPSLSMTLEKAYTEILLEYRLKENDDHLPSLDFWFEGQKKEGFENKIAGYLRGLAREFPLMGSYHFIIRSRNTFPHSTGIASSASSMSALGLCLADFISTVDSKIDFSLRLASELSRLASGSACRSVYGGFTIWGQTDEINGTSDRYAIPVPFEVDPVFRDMRDAILVVSSGEKEVSSRAGHSLMEGHPYAGIRYQMAVTHIAELSKALEKGDMDKFVYITEYEALNLHALMMTSPQSYLLFEPGTVNIVKKIRSFRKETAIPVCFTLDAGPNVHMLYPAKYKNEVGTWIDEELSPYCENAQWIDDAIGNGPVRMKMSFEL